MRRIALAVFALARCTCDDPLNDLQPKIVVTPESIDLGEHVVGQPFDGVYTIGSTGSAPLHVFEVAIQAADAPPEGSVDATGAAFQALSVAEDIPIRGTVDGTLRFTPPSRGTFAGTLMIRSDDKERREVRVPVKGIGGPPRITAAPNPLDFGRVNEGPGKLQTVLITNSGFDTLVVGDVHVRDGTATDAGPSTTGFWLPDDAPRSFTLAPAQSLSVPVRLDPRADLVAAAPGGVLRDALIVVSDAENAPTLEVPMSATVNLAPRAVAVELITRRSEYKTGVGREVVVDGSDTVDPEGDPFTFAWTLASAPQFSQAILAGTLTAGDCTDDGQCDVASGYHCTDTGTRKCRQVARTRVTPDLVGEYVVRLHAQDADGAYSEADMKILPRDFAVVLTWYAEANAPCHAYTPAQCAAMSIEDQRTFCCGQSDVDLHLLRPGGTLGDYGTCPAQCVFDSTSDAGVVTSTNWCVEDDDAHQSTCRQQGGDVAYANRYPEWADAGRADDPRLDVDDVRGDGPEVISLDSPADGEYTAVVHYCTDRIGEPTVANVQVYVKGVLTSQIGPQLLDVEGDAWIAARMMRAGDAWTITPQINVFDPAPPADLCTR